jgi:hypothetical protein
MHQPDTHSTTAALAPDELSPDVKLDHLSIFSAPAIEIVFQWWIESNRRWTERNGPKALTLPAVVRREAQ